MESNDFSQPVSVFRKQSCPEEAFLAGHAWLVARFSLQVPLPETLCLVSTKNREYQQPPWRVFPRRYLPRPELFAHCTFALKYEALDLGLFHALFRKIPPETWQDLIAAQPNSQFTRKIWFLYEWLLGEKLNLPDLKQGNYTPILDPKRQYPGPERPSKRHRITNNLPGTPSFCPLIRKTEKLENFLQQSFREAAKQALTAESPQQLERATAFLLLKDSRASFQIEKENPLQSRAIRWGQTIGKAGTFPLSLRQLEELQKEVLAPKTRTHLGLRNQGSFIGEHDRRSGLPLPEHIPARPQDLPALMEGLLQTHQLLLSTPDFPAVLQTALIAFGFVFIHPFADGNGRLHRYLIHHILIEKDGTPQGITFPISAAVLRHIDRYRNVLLHFSRPRLALTEWAVTAHYNIEVKNPTAQLFRFFDATPQAEFLCDCLSETLKKDLPEELDYLARYDRFKSLLNEIAELSPKQIGLLLRFLEQGKGKLSQRVRQKEFSAFSATELQQIQDLYREVFLTD